MKTFHLEGFGDLPFSRKQAYSFYKMVPLEDGFPGRKTLAGSVVPHPIYGTYLIRDNLTAYKQTGDAKFLEKARQVADATLSRMTKVGEALIFYYEDNGLLNFSGGTFYSGLTQSRYLMPLFDLSTATKDQRYAVAAHAVSLSLMIPAEDGGVMRHFGDGSVIEEFPHEAPNFVLNGWTTAMIQVFEYAIAADDMTAKEFAEANMRALVELLPLYDVPELANSRYRLSGGMSHRLRATAPFKVLKGNVRVGDEQYAFHIQEGNAKWMNIVRQDKPDRVQLETILLRHRMPLVNVLDLVVESSEEQVLDYYPRIVRYDPFSRLPGIGWGPKRSFPLKKGRQSLSIKIPWEDAPFVGEPTTFSKKVPEADGTIRQRNVYHWLHVSNLYRLFQITGDFRLVTWISKWLRYSDAWSTMEIYQHPQIDYAPVGAFKVDVQMMEALAAADIEHV